MTVGSLRLDKVQDALYDWVKNVTAGVIPEEHILWRDQSQALPGRPCVTLKIIDGPKGIGGAVVNLSDSPGKKFNQGEQMEMTVSIQVFGNTNLTQVQRPVAGQVALALHSSLTTEQFRQPLRNAGIAIQDRGDPKNLSALEESQYEDRAGFDVVLGLAQNVIDDPSTIETVVSSGLISGKTVNETITGL